MKRQLKEYEADLQKALAIPADAALFVNGAPTKKNHFLDQGRVSVSRNLRGGYGNGGRREKKEEKRDSRDAKMVCFNCGKRGNRQANCQRFGGGAYRQKPGTQEHRNQQEKGSTRHEAGSSAVVHNSGATAWLGRGVTGSGGTVQGSRGGSSCFIDTECSRHMTWDKSLFTEYRKMEKGECQVEVADNRLVQAEGVGIITLNLTVFGVVILATVRNVLHVPSLGTTLISHAQLGKVGIHIDHVKNYGFYLPEFGPDGRVVGLAPEVDHLYPLLLANPNLSTSTVHKPYFPTTYLVSVSTSFLLWH